MSEAISKNRTEISKYREIKIGKTLYRVTSVYTGEKNLGETLEQLAIKKVLNEIRQGPHV